MGFLNLQDWLIYFSLAITTQEANNLCRDGKVRVNGQIQSDPSYVPEANDTLTSTEHDYTYIIPNFNEVDSDVTTKI